MKGEGMGRRMYGGEGVGLGEEGVEAWCRHGDGFGWTSSRGGIHTVIEILDIYLGIDIGVVLNG